MDDFTKAYIECLEWVQTDNEIKLTSSDFEAIENDCRWFQKKAWKYMKDLDTAQCGHDFYLTRNGHGSGFWDRGYDEKIAVPLCRICKDFGESYEGQADL